MYYKTLKIRLLPTPEQEELMWKHIYSSRFIWNYLLNIQNERKERHEYSLSSYDMIKLLPIIKKQQEYGWLKEVSNTSLQRVCCDLGWAFKKFFNKSARYPKFKTRKRSRDSFPICGSANDLYFLDNSVQIQKLGKIKYKTDYQLIKGRGSYQYANPRVSLNNGKWILTVGVKCENQTHNLNGKIGIDLGVKELAIVAFEDKQIIYHNINKNKKIKRLKHKIGHLQHIRSRKYKVNGSYEDTKNIIKINKQIKDIYYHIACIRNNYLHHITSEIVSLHPCRVAMEDLNIMGLVKNKRLATAIYDECFSEFIRQMKYKCEINNIDFVQADRFYPSSKTCSCCGHIKKNLKLTERTYKCDKCGFIIDRDYNAAINLMNYGT